MQKQAPDILITDDALRDVICYGKKSDKNKQRIETIINNLKNYCLYSCNIYNIENATRPLWIYNVDKSNILCFSVGKGLDKDEIRIVCFRDNIEIHSAEAFKMLEITGDLKDYPEIVDCRIIEKCIADTFPIAPAVTIDGLTNGLATYLSPKTEHELNQIAERDEMEMDSLPFRKFRKLSLWKNPEDLSLRLNPQQELVIHEKRPLLIQGSAGSGKTTIIAHIANNYAFNIDNNKKILIVVYNNSLKTYINSLILGLSQRDEHSKKITVFTWRELCNYIAKLLSIPKFKWINKVETIHSHLRWLRQKFELSNEIEIQELQEYIRAVLKGNSIRYDKPLISYDEYMEMLLSIERLRDCKYHESIYSIAKKYQKYLESNSLVDDLDAARILLNYREQLPLWDLVLIDEIQDYTLNQQILMVSLSKKASGVVLAGDEYQVVYPSYFNWNRCKQAIREAWSIRPPNPIFLDFNYRNPRPIVDLTNEIMSLRSERLKLSQYPKIRSDQSLTPKPIRFIIARKQLNKIISLLANNIGSLGVICNGDKGYNLTEINFHGIGFRRAFTPQSAKGLEFDVVCLVGFNDDYRDLIIRGKSRLSSSAQFINFNEVHVSFSRTRCHLIFIDFKSPQRGLTDHLEEIVPFRKIYDSTKLLNYINDKFLLISSEGWIHAAIEFEHQDALLPAAECWERAEEYLKAAENYKKVGKLKNASLIFERIGEYLEAGKIFEELKSYRKSAENYRKAKAFKIAAKNYELASDKVNAAECWLITENFHLAGKLFEEVGEFKRAAESYARCGLYREAALNFENYVNKGNLNIEELSFCLRQATKNWNKSGDLKQIDSLFFYSQIEKKSLKDISDIYNCMLSKVNIKKGDNKQAANYCEKIKKPELSANLWDELQIYERAGNDWLLSENHLNSAISYEKAENFYMASQSYEKSKNYLKAAENYVKVENYQKAGSCYEKCGNYQLSAENYEKCDNFSKAALSYSKIKKSQRAAALYVKSGKFLNAANEYANYENYKDAAICCEILATKLSNNPSKQCEILIKAIQYWHCQGYLINFRLTYFNNLFIYCPTEIIQSKYFQIVALYWKSISQNDLFEYAISNIKDKNISANLWETLENFKKAAEDWNDYAILTSNKKYFSFSAINYLRNKNYKDAINLYILAEEHIKAYKIIKQIIFKKIIAKNVDDFQIKIWLLEVAAAFEKAKNTIQAIKVYYLAKEYNRIGYLLCSIQQYEMAAKCYVRVNNLKAAIKSYEAAKNFSMVAQLYESNFNFIDAAKVYSKQHEFEHAAILFEKAKDYESAEKNWLLFGDTGKAAKSKRKFMEAERIKVRKRSERIISENAAKAKRRSGDANAAKAIKQTKQNAGYKELDIHQKKIFDELINILEFLSKKSNNELSAKYVAVSMNAKSLDIPINDMIRELKRRNISIINDI